MKLPWVGDKVLPVWTADAEEFSITVRRHARKRFSWMIACEFQIPSGVEQVTGSATSLKEAKQMSEAAAELLESDPIDIVYSMKGRG